MDNIQALLLRVASAPFPAMLPLVAGLIALTLYAAYRMALPKPIPGIPYNKAAAKSILGDLPALLEAKAKSGGTDALSYVCNQPLEHNTPIFQVFPKPFGKPWVLLTDFREAHDILTRRIKEFDRSKFFKDVFAGVIPYHQIRLNSTDPQFKVNRLLVRDLMTPAFLHQVSAPSIYVTLCQLIDLWTEKVRLADGHPFSAKEDVYNFGLDAIWAATFPFETKNSYISAQLPLLRAVKYLNQIDTLQQDEALDFPETEKPPSFEAVLELSDSLQVAASSVFPVLAHWLYRQTPRMRRAIKMKDDYIENELAKAEQRFSNSETAKVNCAMDHIVKRERLAAKKENRNPVYNTLTIKDELLGFLIAGHETTSTTICWGLKFLTDCSEKQSKLRDALRKAFAVAYQEKRQPTADEITETSVPYLDACIEEVNRKSTTAPVIVREAAVDAPVLGHMIPKGTDVFMLNHGGECVAPPANVNIPEGVRSESSRSTASSSKKVGSWDPSDVREFKPERWLVQEDGKELFNPLAGPQLVFGAGPRGCFGRKLAYLELRMVLVLLFWNFEFQSVPAQLSSYTRITKGTDQPLETYVRLKASC